MSLFKKIKFDCLRKQPGYYDDFGRWIEPDPLPFNIKGTLQPLSPEEIQLLPEGRRTSESYNIFSKSKLNVSNIETQTNADYVLLDGIEFEVLSCAEWKNNLIKHNHIVIVKVDEHSDEQSI